MKILDWIKIAVGAVGGAMTYIWGPMDAWLTALIVLMVMDYVTGVIKAAVTGKLCSAVGFKGLLKKLLILALVALGAIFAKLIPGADQALRTAVTAFYCANEALSVMENAGEMGVPLPAVLKNAIQKLREEKARLEEEKAPLEEDEKQP